MQDDYPFESDLRRVAEVELAALRNDAERYRWLRTHRVHQFSTWRKDADGVSATGPFYAEHLDAAIDAAMAEAPAVG